MKQKLIIGVSVIVFSFCSCNDSGKKETNGDPQKTLLDSLEKDVDDGHMVGMAKYGKLKSMKFEAERILDSLAKLPAKARDAAAPLKDNLNELVVKLNDAKEAMDKWMREFDMDSAVNNIENRIKYLAEEKLKVDNLKQLILESLARADSLLKRR